LVDFIDRGVNEDAPSIPPEGLLSEWVVELSLLKMIVEMHDTEHSFSGLVPKHAGKQVLWSRETGLADQNLRGHLVHMDFKSVSELRQHDERDDVENVKQKGSKDHESETHQDNDGSSRLSPN
jgi:hypothetical protein